MAGLDLRSSVASKSLSRALSALRGNGSHLNPLSLRRDQFIILHSTMTECVPRDFFVGRCDIVHLHARLLRSDAYRSANDGFQTLSHSRPLVEASSAGRTLPSGLPFLFSYVFCLRCADCIDSSRYHFLVHKKVSNQLD